jgi:hypothetical protein
MEITGKIIEILPVQTGQGQKGEWKKQLFILETMDQFPKKICIESWNDKLPLTVDPSKTVKVFFDLESREYNGKWYTNVKAWKMDVVGAAAKPDEIPPHTYDFDNEQVPIDNDPDGDLPF